MGWVEKRVREEMAFRGFSENTIKAYLRTARTLDSLIVSANGDLNSAFEAFIENKVVRGVDKSAFSFIKKEVLGNFNRRGVP